MRILVTSIGSWSADCVVRSLKEQNCYVVGCDIYPSGRHVASAGCDVVYQVPLALNETNYLDSLLDIIKENSITHLFPLTDAEIDVLRKHKYLFVDVGVCLCISNDFALSIARDKLKLYHHFKNDDLMNVLPTYQMTNEINEYLPFPYIAKKYNGRSSEGLMLINNEQDLQRIEDKRDYIIQMYKSGAVFTVDYVRSDKTGNDFAIPREELVRTSKGAGLIVKVTNNNDLCRMTSCVGRELKINGCVNMEFINHDGLFYLIDINPRFSAGVEFSKLVGYDMVRSHLYCFLDMDILPSVKYADARLSKSVEKELLATLWNI